MSLGKDEAVVPHRGRAISIALLNIADELGYGPEVVKTSPTLGGYIVPSKVAKKFNLDKVDENAEPPEYAAEAFAPTSPANEPGAADPAKDVDEDEQTDEQRDAAEAAEKQRLADEAQAQADAEQKAKDDAAEVQRLADEQKAADEKAEADRLEAERVAAGEPVAEPAKNAKRDLWLEFAKDKVARTEGATWDEEDDELGRDELVSKFGTPDHA